MAANRHFRGTTGLEEARQLRLERQGTIWEGRLSTSIPDWMKKQAAERRMAEARTNDHSRTPLRRLLAAGFGSIFKS